MAFGSNRNLFVNSVSSCHTPKILVLTFGFFIAAFPLEENSCTFAGTNDNCTYLNSEKNEINWEAEMNGNPLRRLPQVALPDVQNCSNFLEYEAAARRDGNDDDEEDEDTDILLRRKRQNVAVSSRRLVLVIGITVDVRHATFAVGPFIHPRRDRRSRASFLRFFLSTPGENDGLRYSVTAHALCIPSGRVDNIGRGRFQRLQLLSRQPPRGDYCINIIDRVSTRCERFSIDFTFSVVYPFTPGRPDEVRLVLLPDGISRSRFHCRGDVINVYSIILCTDQFLLQQEQDFSTTAMTTTTTTTTTTIKYYQ